jgi:hypothetical protein
LQVILLEARGFLDGYICGERVGRESGGRESSKSSNGGGGLHDCGGFEKKSVEDVWDNESLCGSKAD